MTFIKPKKLQIGDTIATISPSWGGPSVYPHVYEAGLETLKKLGFKIKEFPSARKDNQYNYEHPEFRAKDINDAFADQEVKAIFTSIGGEDSVRILPYFNLDIIKANPKIILGFSDATTFNTYLNHRLGLVTLNGISIMGGFAEWDALGKDFQEHIKTILLDNPATYTYQPFDFYDNGYEDWGNPANLGKIKEKIPNPGWTWLQGKTKVVGELFGGCIEVFEFMKSTKFWPAADFWQGKILFFETSEDKPTPEQIKWMLRNYGSQGIFDQLTGLLFGRARDYTDDEKKQLNEIILQVVRGEFKNDRLSIITNLDFGHTDPQWIMPLGIKAEIDCQAKTFKLVEKIFTD